MTNESDRQLTFDFHLPPKAQVASKTHAPVVVEHAITERCVAPPAAIYSLSEHRVAKVAKEAKAHFSAILKLVAHLE